MLKKLMLAFFICLLFACRNTPEGNFGTFADDFVTEYSALFPDETPLSIDNEKLALLPPPTVGYLNSVRQFHVRFSKALKNFDLKNLPPNAARDARKAGNILKTVGTYLNDYQRNPQRFNVLHGFHRILTADYASDEFRLKTMLSKLEKVPNFYATAKAQLRDVDRADADAAVTSHVETYLFFDEILPDFLKEKSQLTPQYQTHLEAARLAIKDYAAFIESFRLQ